jgi:hypothetical protein
MSTPTNQIKPLPINPSPAQVDTWLSSTVDIASDIPCNGRLHGLTSEVMTAAEYQALPGAPFPIPLLVRNVGPYPAGAAAAREAYDHHDKACDKQDTAVNTLRTAIIGSVHPDLIATLRVRRTGFLGIHIRTIIQHIRTTYATVTPTDLRATKRYLQNAKHPEATMTSVIAEHVKAADTANTAGQPFSEADRVEWLLASVNGYPEYEHTLRNFSERFPTLALQTFNNLATLLTDAERNHTPSSAASMGFSALAPNASNRSAFGATDKPSLPRPEEFSTEELALVATHRRQQAGKPATPKTKSTGTDYCWYHGTCGHAGKDCDKRSEKGFQVAATSTNRMNGAHGPWRDVKAARTAHQRDKN